MGGMRKASLGLTHAGKPLRSPLVVASPRNHTTQRNGNSAVAFVPSDIANLTVTGIASYAICLLAMPSGPV
jgi:hypothetical protein